MKITIIRKKGKPVGYTMTKENDEDDNTIRIIRDMIFFGFDDTAIKYNGRHSSSDEEDDVKTLSWIQKKYSTSGLRYEQMIALDNQFVKDHIKSL